MTEDACIPTETWPRTSGGPEGPRASPWAMSPHAHVWTSWHIPAFAARCDGLDQGAPAEAGRDSSEARQCAPR